MRTAVLCLFVLGLTIAASGQAVQTPSMYVDERPPTASLKARSLETGSISRPLPDGGMAVESRSVFKGVEIRIGSVLVTADEAEIKYGTRGEPDDLELRGKVHLKSKLAPEWWGN
jgi:hypothetical protein